MPPPPLNTRMLTPPLRLIQPLIQTLRPHLNQRSTNNTSRTPKQNQPPTQPIKWLLTRRKEVRAKPMTSLTNAIRNRNERRLLTPRRGNKGCFPAQLQVEAGVGAADEQDETDVAGADVEGADEGGAADCGHDDGEHDVVVGFLEAAGCVCHSAGEGIGDGVGGSLDEVGG